ncbi:MAG: hypothetical protein UR62_C0004G0003 [Candidatus Nomurabacteria bacterium GW2011_GWF2_35_12]|uniref:Uncharacterized protein n=3 Tax=Candidatus Nomuraibacteriota TaxID=1752729 RepID=A0A0G0DV24_9BACT|nr:MAG: hypothetical protein UR62_C0004G0003 [Candidatus Nomurabacteria bacterium GW2011_GWF2_35_12]KKP72952.1 MAG: hypothetical protein UR70_C0002G0021 [Candidatus Nomurabacteria bacterium GW2011_GWB1_35_20]KKP75572.1 MAG: hypothetical protein UR72_C0004G0030 [Parcubacteria group bacterium GW2011_GWC1_35_21]KKP78616.1 MAG: hypothetical protein UR77_C0001G0002 [Candidatus Nomurabacteria bacterium GW2011_GWC2_35_35]KKP88645.1 MAG: hypothetical protein UR92_C0001G0024 [Candidatus Nomurabacteria b
MYLPLILFFLSLAGIIIMVWRELVLVKNGLVVKTQHSHPFVPDLQKIKYLASKGTKKLSYVTLFIMLRFFIKSSSFIKNKSTILAKEIKTRFKKFRKDTSDETAEKKEVSKYLKIISEYRHKIRAIKHRIKEEEGIE